MTLVFDSKIARYDETDERIERLSAAVQAFVDHWAPRAQAIDGMKERALAAFDAAFEDVRSHPNRAVIAAHYDALLGELAREGRAHRHVLDRMINFYTNDDVDLEDVTIH